MSPLLDAHAWIRSGGAGGGLVRHLWAPWDLLLLLRQAARYQLPVLLTQRRISHQPNMIWRLLCRGGSSVSRDFQSGWSDRWFWRRERARLLYNEWWSLQNRGQSWRINYWSRRLIKRWLYSRLWPGSLRAWRGFVSLAGCDFFNNSVSHLLIWGGGE